MKTDSGNRGWILVFAGFLLILASGTRHSDLINIRRSEHLQEVSPEETTPLVALTTVAFGGFRGLVADALWVRANKMQEEGQYFELVQLAKWITQLEPRVPEVWSFQAWNLAYNISVLFPEFEDRWRWVNHGLDLLRIKGLTHNPNSTDLHWDIGWMFQHKIGMEFDLAHQLYKQKLMEQVTDYLPGGEFDKETLPPEAAEGLRKTFAMDPEYMAKLEAEFGPLDWRIPYTHSLYWSSKGLEFSRENREDRQLRRMQMQALAEMMRGGRLVLSEDGKTWIRFPRPELIPVVIREYERMLEESPYNHYLQKGYANFLNDALLLNADYGNPEEAYRYYEKLVQAEESFPSGEANFQRYVQMELMKDPAELNYNQAMNRLVALLSQSYTTADPILSKSFYQMAEQLHRLYQESRVSEEHRERTGLPDFEVITSLIRASLES